MNDADIGNGMTLIARHCFDFQTYMGKPTSDEPTTITWKQILSYDAGNIAV